MLLDTAVVPCGGLGTRLRSIAWWLPKEMDVGVLAGYREAAAAFPAGA